MYDLAKVLCRINRSAIGKLILKFLRRRVNLFLNDSQHIFQRGLSGKAKICVIHHTAEAGVNENTSVLHELSYVLRISFLVHIVQRRRHKAVSFQRIVHIHQIGLNAVFPEHTVVFEDRFHIIKVKTRSLCIFHCPPVVPVKNDGGFRPVYCMINELAKT